MTQARRGRWCARGGCCGDSRTAHRARVRHAGRAASGDRARDARRRDARAPHRAPRRATLHATWRLGRWPSTRRLSAAELGFLGLHLTSALGYLHRQGVLHLDMKPSNVVAEGGRAKLLDLSVARPAGRVRSGVGTWCYMAPEQAHGGAIGPAADVWGIGGVLFEAATGVCAFDGDEDHPQLVRRALPVRRLRRGLPAPLAAAIDACFAPAPADRPSLARLAAACEEAAGLPACERRLSATIDGAPLTSS